MVSGPDGSEALEVDSLVVSLGLVPNQGLYLELKGQFPEVYAVGDCVTPRKAINAIHDGYKAGNRV